MYIFCLIEGLCFVFFGSHSYFSFALFRGSSAPFSDLDLGVTVHMPPETPIILGTLPAFPIGDQPSSVKQPSAFVEEEEEAAAIWEQRDSSHAGHLDHSVTSAPSGIERDQKIDLSTITMRMLPMEDPPPKQNESHRRRSSSSRNSNPAEPQHPESPRKSRKQIQKDLFQDSYQSSGCVPVSPKKSSKGSSSSQVSCFSPANATDSPDISRHHRRNPKNASELNNDNLDSRRSKIPMLSSSRSSSTSEQNSRVSQSIESGRNSFDASPFPPKSPRLFGAQNQQFMRASPSNFETQV